MNCRNIHVGIILITGLFTMACKKDKLDNANNSNTSLIKSAGSNIRLFNFTDVDADITINNIPLTAYGQKDGSGKTIVGTGNVTQLGLQYFPKEAWKAADGGSPFTIPTTLLDKNGRADVRVTARGITIPELLQNNTLKPVDYYLFYRLVDNKDSFYYVSVNRETNPPAIAQNCKIRIMNFGQENDPLGLTGPITLTYADGSIVDSKLTNVPPNSASPYVEIPYGAYQFKMFLSNGNSIDVTRQLTQLPVQPDYQSTLPLPQPQQGLTVPVRSYKPGGAYTVLFAPAAMKYLSKYGNEGGEPLPVHFNINTYRVVTDIEPGVNFAFARVQAANALPGTTVNVLVDGQPVATKLAFATHSEYTVLTRGEHTISINDANGKQLAQQTLTLYPYDNYTIWATQKTDGTADIVCSAVNMTSTVYDANTSLNGEDGSMAVKTKPYSWSTRFLNLTPDLPFATFTNDYSLFIDYDYQHNDVFPGTCNLVSNDIPALDPFLNYQVGKLTLGMTNPANVGVGTATKIRVYQSSAGKYPQLPGTLRSDILPLTVKDAFIANKSLYTEARFMPWAEIGIYTVALIGKTAANAPSDQRARIMVIKHNK